MKNNNLFLKIFWIVLLLSSSLLFSYGFIRLRSINIQIEDSLNKLSKLSYQISHDEVSVNNRIIFLENEIKKIESRVINDASLTDLGVNIKKLLRKYDNRIIRYQVINMDSGEELEFALESNPLNFFNFLKNSVSQNWNISFLSIRNEKNTKFSSIIFRVGYAD